MALAATILPVGIRTAENVNTQTKKVRDDVVDGKEGGSNEINLNQYSNFDLLSPSGPSYHQDLFFTKSCLKLPFHFRAHQPMIIVLQQHFSNLIKLKINIQKSEHL